MDPNNQTATNPQGVDDPSVVPADPQGQAGDSGQEGNAPAADGGGGEPQQAQAPSEIPKWAHQLTDDLKSDERITKHQSPTDLARDYLNYASKADRLVELPGDDADDEAREQFLSKLRPGTPEDYQFDDVPEGIPYSKEAEQEFRDLAHKMGLTQQQAAQLRQYDVERTGAVMQQQQQARKQGMDALRKEWGDSFDGNVKQAQSAFKEIASRLGDDKLSQRMVETGYGSDPDMLKTFYGIWEMIKPDTVVNGSIDGNSGGTVAESWYPDTDFLS